MSSSNMLQGIAIESPCTASWEEMSGTDQVRVCTHCDLSVHDLSQMTAAKAFKLVRTSKGRLCVRMRRNPAGEVVTRPVYQKLHAITRRTSRIAAGAFTAVMGLSGAAYAQSTASGTSEKPLTVAAATVKPLFPGPSGWLSGRALDQNEAVIPGASVVLKNEQTGDSQSVTTDEEGRYRIWLEAGFTYELAISSPGFATASTPNIAMDNGGEKQLDVTLNTEVGEVMGAMVMMPAYTQPLLIAVSAGDHDAVRDLLRRGENVNQAEDFGATPLSVAVGHGDYEMVELLLRAGASVRLAGPNGNTPLFWVHDDNEPRLISLLIRYGADVDHVNMSGDTPLIQAAEWNSRELTQALIKAGANVNAQSQDGNTALMIAAQEGNAETVEALLAGGAFYALRNAAGQDALALALLNDRDDVVELLRAAGATDPVR